MQEKKLVIARETGDRRGGGTAYGNLGTAYKSLGRCMRAIEMHEKEVVIARMTGSIYGQATSLHDTGVVWEKLNELDKGLDTAWAGPMHWHKVEQSLGEGWDASRLSQLEKIKGNYRLVVRLLLAAGRKALAVAVCGMGKATGLSHVLEGEELHKDASSVDDNVVVSAGREWERVRETVRSERFTVIDYSC